MQLLRLLGCYWKTKHRHFKDRNDLEFYQQQKIRKFIKNTLKKSPYFSQYTHLPLDEFPLMNKQIMMDNFDQMNTAGLKLDELMACAMKAEETRDFESTIGHYSVGLSSGTSNRRGVFVASEKERAIWAGSMLAKFLPRGLFYGERVALFLRANNKLYDAVNNRWLSLKFFDLFNLFEKNLEQLNAYKPTIIIAPAQVLRAIALAKMDNTLTFTPKNIVSAAEVLDIHTRKLLKNCFGTVSEIYQATEGFLGITCPHETLHLNEDIIHVEKEWIDENRFVPIITDFTRQTQPIVRYRLDDVLIQSSRQCPCGSLFTAISQIEGRCNDVLVLPGISGQPVTLFADLCSRAIAQALPLVADYQLIQEGDSQLQLNIEGDIALTEICKERLLDVFHTQNVDIKQLNWILTNNINTEYSMMVKKRKIIKK